MPFGTWMALAKAQPVRGFDEGAQGILGHLDDEQEALQAPA
jgi:hypothetical protein